MNWVHSASGTPVSSVDAGSESVSTDPSRRRPEEPVSTQDVVNGLALAGAAGNADGDSGKQAVDVADVGQPIVDENLGHVVRRHGNDVVAQAGIRCCCALHATRREGRQTRKPPRLVACEGRALADLVGGKSLRHAVHQVGPAVEGTLVAAHVDDQSRKLNVDGAAGQRGSWQPGGRYRSTRRGAGAGQGEMDLARKPRRPCRRCPRYSRTLVPVAA